MIDPIDRAVALLQRGQTDEAVDLVRQMLERRVSIDQETQRRLDLRNRGQYDAAISAIDEAIQKAGGGTLLGRLLHDRGTTLQGAKHFTEALDYLRAAYILRQAAGDTVGAAYSAFQIPMCRSVAGDPQEALRVEFRNTADILARTLREKGDTLEVLHEGNLRQNLAYCLQFDGNYADAFTQYQAVLVLRQQASDDRGYAMTQSRMAECLLAEGRLDEAEKTAQAALRFFEEIRDQNRIQQVHATLQRIAEARNA